MKFGIRWKLMLSYLALVILIAGALYGYLNQTRERNLTEGIAENLFNEARLARLMTSSEIVNLRKDAPEIARGIGREIKARVTIIAMDGNVAGDSERTEIELPGMENHADRPEFIGAIKNGSGRSVRYSSTLHTDMLYIALPFATKNMQTGVVRLALPLAKVEKAKTALHAALGAAAGLALICSFLLSYLFSNIITRPLRLIAANAALIGKGGFSSRIPVTGRDEVGELAIVINDMAARIEDQLNRISAERHRLDTILSGMGEGVLVTDSAGIITLVNPSFRSLFSIGDAREGESLIEIIRHPDLIAAMKKVLATREEILAEIVLQSLPGTRVSILTHWVPLLEDGVMQGAVAVFHDISDIKRLEQVRKDFVANVSHELRTPVTVIKGYAETLTSDAASMNPEQIVHFSRIINNHAERLSGLINDLLTLSQLESGKMEMEIKPVTLKSSVNRACNLLEQKASDKQIGIHQQINIGETMLLADPGRLEQVLINLLDNAIAYTPTQGVVTVSAMDQNTMVRIDVTDNGIGIPPKDLPRIFERFYRVDDARSKELRGTGLGLSIVRHIVQTHGGTVSVQSVPGKGSTFSFTLKKA
jgi:two-component system phosphate regulon sensor histidine kinase PhoR